MHTLQGVIEKCKEKNINIYEVSFPDTLLTEGVEFSEINAFFEFLKVSKIDTVFAKDYYEYNCDYYITEETIKEVMGNYVGEEELNFILPDIEKYNDKIGELVFDIPFLIVIVCVYNGKFFYVELINEFLLDGEVLQEPEEVLSEIVHQYEEKIHEVKERREEELENLKEELKEYILNDEDFYKSTNKRMRYIYAQNLFRKKLGAKYEALKKHWVSPSGTVYIGATDFVEMLWREYGKKK